MDAKDLVLMLMKNNKVSFREIAKRTGKGVSGVQHNLASDMRVSTFVEYCNKLGCDVIIRDFNHNGAEWRVGDGLRICESEYERPSKRREQFRKSKQATEGSEV